MALGLRGDDSIRPLAPAKTPTFQWKPALEQSWLFLVLDNSVRLTQERTRRELGGAFWSDYGASVRGFGGWGDGDGPFTNYIAHPMQGSVSSYILIQNDRKGRLQEFGVSSEYWKSRMRGTLWSAAYSVNFELGPFSEASIGNVGKHAGTMGWVDIIMTPVGGLGWQVAEDAVDRYLVRWAESRTSSRRWRLVLRSTLNPTRALANILRSRPPWHRDTRNGIGRP